MCWDTVNKLDGRRIKTKIDNNSYHHVSGYDEYNNDIEWIIKEYENTVELGPMVIIIEKIMTLTRVTTLSNLVLQSKWDTFCNDLRRRRYQ